MKKLFISVILSTFFLMNPCFGYDFDKGEVSHSVSATVFKGGYDSVGFLPGFAIGYYLTDNIEVAAEYAIVPPSVSVASASLYYYHKIKNTDITPYIRAGVGVYTEGFSNSSLSIYLVSFGVSFPLFSDDANNVFIGYRPIFPSLSERDRDMIHALEFRISSKWF